MPSQIVLAWVMAQPSVTAPSIVARTMQRLRDNRMVTDLVLDPEVNPTYSRVSAATPKDYPYGCFGALQLERYNGASEQSLREL